MKKPKFMSTPVGANKRFLVKNNGTPCAGFDTMPKARAYVAMQKDKKNGKGNAANSVGMTWDIVDIRN